MGTNSVFFLLAPCMRATLVASRAGLTTATELSLLTVLASQAQADGSQAGHTRHQLALITMPAPTPPPAPRPPHVVTQNPGIRGMQARGE